MLSSLLLQSCLFIKSQRGEIHPFPIMWIWYSLAYGNMTLVKRGLYQMVTESYWIHFQCFIWWHLLMRISNVFWKYSLQIINNQKVGAGSHFRLYPGLSVDPAWSPEQFPHHQLLPFLHINTTHDHRKRTTHTPEHSWQFVHCVSQNEMPKNNEQTSKLQMILLTI